MSALDLDWSRSQTTLGNLWAGTLSIPASAPVSSGQFRAIERPTEMDTSSCPEPQNLLRHVRSNIVQSIRAFRIQDLQQAAHATGQHFLYANLAHAQTKQDALDLIAVQFHFPAHFGKNFDALYDCLTDPLHKAGPQPGFVVVLDQLPIAHKFDKEVREQFLDCFRDAADYWAERKIPFRCFYSFL